MLVTVEDEQGLILAQTFLDGDARDDVVPGVVANGADDPSNKSGFLNYRYPANGAAFLKYHILDLGSRYGTVLDGGCVAPTITITAAEIANGEISDDGTLTLTFTTSLPTADFGLDDIVVENGVLSNFAGSSTTYTATLTPNGAGAVTVDVDAGTFAGPSDHDNIAAEQFNWTHQVFCAENQRIQDNTCVDCPAGTTNEAGDDASGADSVCDETICDVDEYVSANACAACPAGTTNVGGDNAAGEDTTCDDTICGVDQYVSANACTACPAGTTNADGGDNAAGADTTCDDTICGVDQYVAANTCTACPAGTENAAGDNASGGDTQCEDIDECADGNNGGCDANAACVNAARSGEAPSCTCNEGFAGDGINCEDIDECADGNNGGCDVNATCEDAPTPGDEPICVCIEG